MKEVKDFVKGMTPTITFNPGGREVRKDRLDVGGKFPTQLMTVKVAKITTGYVVDGYYPEAELDLAEE